MNKIFLLSVLLFAGFAAISQSKPFRGMQYSNKEDGDIKTVTLSTDESARKIYTVEVKNKNGILKEKQIWKKSLDGKWQRRIENLKPSGKIKDAVETEIDEYGKIKRIEITVEKGKNTILERTAEGNLIRADGSIILPEEHLKCLESEIRVITNDLESNDDKEPLSNNSIPCGKLFPVKKECRPNLNIFGGPSVLFADHGQDKETFIGGHVFTVYNFTTRIGAGIDGSLHYKNIGDQKLTRSFLLARGQYTFNNKDNCDQKFVPDVHILAGLGFESFKYTFNGNTTKSSGNGFAFGAGAGFNVRLTKTVGIGGSVDYIGVKYKNNDDVNSNVRVSLGAMILFWEQGFRDKPQIVY